MDASGGLYSRISMYSLPQHPVDFWCRCPWCSAARFGRIRAKCEEIEASIAHLPDAPALLPASPFDATVPLTRISNLKGKKHGKSERSG